MDTLEGLINNTTFTREEIENMIKFQAWIDKCKKYYNILNLKTKAYE